MKREDINQAIMDIHQRFNLNNNGPMRPFFVNQIDNEAFQMIADDYEFDPNSPTWKGTVNFGNYMNIDNTEDNENDKMPPLSLNDN